MSIPSPVKKIKAERSKVILDEDANQWEVIDEYEIIEWDVVGDEVINDFYNLAKVFTHRSGLAMQPVYVGKPDCLYL
jgi:hypothetical protein